MTVGHHSAVSFHFTLKNDQGQVLETSVGSTPLAYLHGSGGIVPGLEEAMTGKKTGEKFQITLPPEKAYGMRDERLVQKIPKKEFPNPNDLKPGMQFQVGVQGGTMILTISAVQGEEVTVDGNPELAGMTLHFDIEVTEVRAATAEEIAHGHVHGPGGHHH